MTYGVYSKDLKSSSIKDVSFDTAKKYCHKGDVVCSLKPITYGFKLSLNLFWKDWQVWRFRWCRRWDWAIYLGPLVIRWEKLWYMGPAQIVFDKDKEDAQ